MLLEIRDLTISIASPSGVIDVVDKISLSIPKGKVVAVVGESGCGKSLTAYSILRLLPKPAVRVSNGVILWRSSQVGTAAATNCQRATISTATVRERGRPQESTESKSPLDSIAALPCHNSEGFVNLLDLTDRQMQSIRGRDIAMIFQEPMTALNPVFTIGEQIAEVLMLHREVNKKRAGCEAADFLTQVGIADAKKRLHQYPHEFSGGMRQRVLIAMALAGRPSLLIADEPTTALDVTIQAQILDLLRSLQAQTGMSILLITHDLGVVAQLADYVYVMYAGRIVEHTTAQSLFAHPMHPYSQGLFACTPRLDDAASAIEPIPGTVPDPANFPAGCRFHPRCGLTRRQAADSTRVSLTLPDQGRVLRRCVERFDAEPSGVPPLREIQPNHFVACWEA